MKRISVTSVSIGTIAFSGILAIGLLVSPFSKTNATQPKVRREVVVMTSMGDLKLIRSSSSAGAPVFPQYDWGNPNAPSIDIAEAMAQLLDQGYNIQSFDMDDTTAMVSVLMVK